MSKFWGSKRLFAAAGVSALFVTAPAVQAVPIWAVDDNPGQRLLNFDSESPTALASSIALTGLEPNEKLVGIDFRINSVTPTNSLTLYGVGSSGRIYTINTASGAATFVYQISQTLNGTEFGVDFNPAADRLRIVSDLDQNLRIDISGAATFNDTALPTNSNITSVAYNNVDTNPSSATTLFGIDSFSNQLVRIGGVNGGAPEGSPNLGVVTVIGSLVNFDPTSVGGFDIASGSSDAFLAARNAAGGGSMLSTIDLPTGVATVKGFIGNPEDGLVIKDIAVAPAPGVPEPTGLALLGLGLTGLLARRRRGK